MEMTELAHKVEKLEEKHNKCHGKLMKLDAAYKAQTSLTQQSLDFMQVHHKEQMAKLGEITDQLSDYSLVRDSAIDWRRTKDKVTATLITAAIMGLIGLAAYVKFVD